MKDIESTKKEIKRLIGEARITEAIELINQVTDYAQNDSLSNEWITLKSRHNSEINKIIRGISGGNEKQKIINSLTLFTDKAIRIARERNPSDEAQNRKKPKWIFIVILGLFLPSFPILYYKLFVFKPIKNPIHCELQDTFSYKYYEERQTANSSVEDIYIESNPGFYNYVKNLTNKTSSNLKGVTLVSAVAGYGKTFLINPILKDIIQNEYTSISLSRLAKDNPKETINQPNLRAQKNDLKMITLNSLPEFNSQFIRSKLKEYLDSCSFLIMDEFDEIHPNSCKEILTYLMDNVLNKKDSSFKQVIILGRPESFKPFLDSPRYPGGLKIYKLEKLKIDDLGDLEYRVKNYIEYKNVSVEDTVTYVSNVLQAINENKDLSYSFPNLGLSTCIIQKANNGDSFSKIPILDFRETMVDQLFERAFDKHKRPTQGFDHWDIYKIAFQEVAAKYQEINSEGAFEVGSNDYVSVEYGKNIYKFDVEDLLNHSGLIDIKPANEDISYYAFEPFWLHEYFQEKYNGRQLKSYKEKVCD